MKPEPFYVPMYYEDATGPRQINMACYPWRQCVQLYEEWQEQVAFGQTDLGFPSWMERIHLGRQTKERIVVYKGLEGR